ncbi:MAG TPA: hypothetical protein VEC99_17205, partial [Clostridia bacterium]|nr:hypothetical protein [Clostridia bacterium]
GADQSIAVSAVDGTGKEQAAEFSQGRLQLRLNQAPQYISLGNRSTILSAMAAWNAQLLTPLVEAGKAKDLRLSIQVTNPFSGKIQAEFRLQLPDESDVASLKTTLEPGESRTLPLNATVLRRAPQQRDIRLVMELFRKGKNGSNQALHGGAEQFHFAISNPLELGIAPSQAGLRLSVSSQNHTPFAGEVKWAGKTRPVQLSLQNAEQILLLGHPNSTAANKSLELRDKKGTVVASIPVPRFQPLSLKGLQAALDGDSKVPASATLVSTNSPDGTDAPFDQAFKLNYDFDEGWRFVRCPPTTPLPVFEGKPAALGLWVFGDNSGNVLRARVTDSSGQTFQPDGFSLNWTGWRWIAIDLSDLSHAGHWGGANDGIVHGQLRLDCPLLLDGTRRKTSGTIYFTGVTVVYP